ncbi:MAG TPA: CHASE3 domain-containing protein [Terricaulis sp.]|nr:CHASE3 domain-containing protein [Terricaulis sp.]
MTVKILGRRFPATATYAVALGAAVLLVLLTVAAALWQADHYRALNANVRDQVEARAHFRLFFRGLQDAETAQRGYLLTGREEYLSPFASGRAEVEREMALIEAQAGSNLARIAEAKLLRSIATGKIDEMALTIELRRRGRLNEALLIVNSDRGRQVMEELRDILGAAERREHAEMLEAMRAAEAASARLRLVVVLAGLLLLGVGALLVMTVRNAMAELRASRDEAQAAHQSQLEEMAARERAEAKVRQMQKMEAIGQITGGVAHDFNNMLAVILSALQLAKRRMDKGQEGAPQFIDSAIDGARRAAALTSRLLAFARRQPLSPAVLDVNRVLGGMSDMLTRTLGEQIEVETVLGAGLWRVHADRHELEQAVLNICVNARDAMEGVGKLTIESSNAYLDEAYASANLDVTAGQYAMIAITDTGAGMSPETKAQAFEPFFTTKSVGKGTGLGLSHVHGFLKQSGGHVAIYSELGVGTTIKLYLPRTQLAEAEEAAPSMSIADEALAGDPATLVLVVEDDDRVRTLSVAALRDLGYTVLHASGGPAALTVLEANPGVALLFTDVVMPEMSGRQLADEAKRRYPQLKVLYTTGYTQNAIVHNGVVDADARLILKPYSLADLARKVRAVLDER